MATALFLAVFTTGLAEPDPAKPDKAALTAGEAVTTPPEDWKGWAKWADQRDTTADPQGHGPDVGSEEWSTAIDRRLKIRGAAHGPDIGSKEWRKAVESKLGKAPRPATDEQRELLSSHDTVARFEGLQDHQCRGLTALCPDRCGDSGKLATFAIVKYLGYQKPGEYGDPRQERFLVLIEDNTGSPKIPAAMRDAILALKAGDQVHLRWNHDYVTRGGSKSPERPIRELSAMPAGRE